MENENIINEICTIIREKNSFYVIGHLRPDGDCIGSQLAFYHFLKEIGKNVRVYNNGPIPEHSMFLKGIENIETTFDTNFNPDVYIFVDTGSPDRVYGGFEPIGFSINIDHHYSNTNFGNINFVDATAAAAGEQVFSIIKYYGAAIPATIAECLFLAIVTDSGSFKFSNTTYRTFEIAAELVRAGAMPNRVSNEFFDSITPQAVHLISQVLSNIRYLCDGKFSWSEVTQPMREEAGGEENEPEGLVSKLRAIKGVEVGVLFHEVKEGGLRASLRSKGNVNVNDIAEKLGGGGHPNAAGVYMRGDYKTLRDTVIEEVASFVHSCVIHKKPQ